MPKGKHGKFNSSRAKKALDKSEGTTTSSGGQGHSRERHAAPKTEGGPSVDAYLINRCDGKPVGTQMSAFLNSRDQDAAVAYAIQYGKATDAVNLKDRKTVVCKADTEQLKSVTVRVAKVIEKNKAECYNAKLREVTVVYEGSDKIVTAYPSASHAV